MFYHLHQTAQKWQKMLNDFYKLKINIIYKEWSVA